LLALLAILALFLNWLRSQAGTMGQVLNNLRNDLLGSNDPLQRAAGILVWRAIAAEAFKSAIEQNLSHGVAALGFYFPIGRPAPHLQRHAHR